MTVLITRQCVSLVKPLMFLKCASSSSWDCCSKQGSEIIPVLPEENQEEKVMCVLN